VIGEGRWRLHAEAGEFVEFVVDDLLHRGDCVMSGKSWAALRTVAFSGPMTLWKKRYHR
jgi:hypothetical protein